MEQINFNKVIGKAALVSVLVLLFLFGSFIALFTFVYPAKLAEWSHSLGFSGISIFCYEKAYEKSQDVNDLYRLLNATITAKDDEKIIENFEKLYEDNSQNYKQFIAYINNYYMTSTQDVLLQLQVTNEDVRLKRHYVQALVRTSQNEKAFLFVVSDLQQEQFTNITNYNSLNFLASDFVFALIQNGSDFAEYERFLLFEVGEVSVNYVNEALTYYENIKSIYEFNLFVRQENENSFELLVICQHLQKVSTTLLFLNETLDAGLDETTLQTESSEFESQKNQLLNELEVLQQ
jgi:hypothetical protein